MTQLIGFWTMWHAYGGYQGLIDLGMAPTTVHRNVKWFRQVFKAHPDEYSIPGLTLDLKQWHAGGTVETE
ncbi:hypothetical protein ASF38_00680 [Aeromicrobium sp. Leaf272]|nr:hypothetical protein ASF38_00680 [Aeromicrobium sp. Leaf272]